MNRSSSRDPADLPNPCGENGHEIQAKDVVNPSGHLHDAWASQRQSLVSRATSPRRALPMFYVFFEAAVYGGRTPRRRHPRRGGHDLGSERQQRKV